MRVRRAQLDLIQLRVARRLAEIGQPMSVSRYSLLENGHIDPTAEERAALAQVLETTEDDIFPVTDTGKSVAAESAQELPVASR